MDGEFHHLNLVQACRQKATKDDVNLAKEYRLPLQSIPEAKDSLYDEQSRTINSSLTSSMV